MKRATRWLLLALGLALALALFAWALREVSLAELGRALSALQAWQLTVILAVNTGLIQLFTLRWWLILRAQGHRVPYLTAARYRLAAFAVSYITPGQHFGGEPVQILLLGRQGVPPDAALASVALDKALEIFANFTVLAGGIILLLAGGLLPGLPLPRVLPFAVLFLAATLLYLLALACGWRPLGGFLRRAQSGPARAVASAEAQLGGLAARPRLLLDCLLASALSWAALFFEFWLMLRYLGLPLGGLQLLAVVIAGRIALLAPTPGALGALEASQVLAVQALGFDPAYGLALGLLIRARDSFFTALGLLLGGAEGLRSYRRTHV